VYCFKKLLIFFSLIVFSKHSCAMDIDSMDIAPGPINSLSQDLVYHTVKALIAGRPDIRYFSEDQENLEALVQDVYPRIGGTRLISKSFWVATDAAMAYFECPKNVLDFYLASQRRLPEEVKFTDSLKVASALHFGKYIEANENFCNFIRCFLLKTTFDYRVFQQHHYDKESKKLIFSVVNSMFDIELGQYLAGYMEKKKRYLDPNLIVFASQDAAEADSDDNFDCEEKRQSLFLESILLKNAFLPLSILKFYVDNINTEVLRDQYFCLQDILLKIITNNEGDCKHDVEKSSCTGYVTFHSPHVDAECNVIAYIVHQCLLKMEDKFKKLFWKAFCEKASPVLDVLSHTYPSAHREFTIRDGDNDGSFVGQCCLVVYNAVRCGSVGRPLLVLLEECYHDDEMISDVQSITAETTPWISRALQAFHDYRPNAEVGPTLISFMRNSRNQVILYDRLMAAFVRISLVEVEKRAELIVKLLQTYSSLKKDEKND
jgi:hypothetical protein